jgi:ribosome-associated protein
MGNPSGRQPKSKAIPLSPEEKLRVAEEAVLDLKSVHPVVLDMREVTVITDYFVICSATSNVHLRAIADRVLEGFEERRIRPLGSEGYRQSDWTLLDFGDVVVHVFSEEARAFYSLERLWDDAPSRELAPENDADE